MRQVAGVSGYGGAGTTTTLIALGLRLAKAGRRVLLAEFTERRSPVLSDANIPAVEGLDVLAAPGDGDLAGLSQRERQRARDRYVAERQVGLIDHAGRYDVILCDFGPTARHLRPDSSPAGPFDGLLYVAGRYHSRDLAHDRETARQLGTMLAVAPTVCATRGDHAQRALTHQFEDFAALVTLPNDAWLHGLIDSPTSRPPGRKTRRALDQLAEAVQ